MTRRDMATVRDLTLTFMLVRDPVALHVLAVRLASFIKPVYVVTDYANA